MQEVFCVIMAGGSGERFWPRSRKDKPKQLLNLFGSETLLEQTVLRLNGFIPDDHIFIITNSSYQEQIRTLCSQLPPENIIGEPCKRDTAPCVALAAGIVKAKAKTDDPVILVLPSDHFICNRNAMLNDLKICMEYAVKRNALATVGIIPSRPSPDYGYIECGDTLDPQNGVHRAARFLEKPDEKTAAELLAKGNCKWNSGMFVFPLPVLLAEMERNAPDLLAFAEAVAAAWGTDAFDATLCEQFRNIRKISIDYALMEHASAIIVKDASFDWDDIGNWTALRNHLEPDERDNVSSGSNLLLDCTNCIAYTEKGAGVLAGIDLKDMILIKTADAVLVAPVSSAPKIKTLLAKFGDREGFGKYL